MNIHEFRDRLEAKGFTTHSQADGFRSRCPNCSSSKQNGKRRRVDKFSATQTNDRILVICHGGCSTDDVCSSLGIKSADLFSDSNTRERTKNEPSARSYDTAAKAIGILTRTVRRQHPDATLVGPWEYLDADDSPFAVVVRFDYADGKTYRQASVRGDRWVCKAPTRRILYRLPELSNQDVVWMHEGEKSADAGWSIGLPSTTSLGGSKQASHSDYAPLDGKSRVYLVPDTGDDGARWLSDITAAISKLDSPPELFVCRFSFEESNCDIVDWLEGSATESSYAIRENLLALCSPLSTETPDDSINVSSSRGETPLARIAHRWASDIEAESVSWLWHGFIPQTGITFLDGDPEAGKTCCALDIIARLTRGDRMPGDAKPERAGVAAILAKEDRYENTIKPRLEAAGAEMTRVSCIDDIELNTPKGIEKRFLTLPSHTQVLAEHLRDIGATLLLIDPYDNHLDDGLNTSSSTDMRRAFTPITEAASSIGCALLIIRHFGKRDYGNAKHKGIGSIGLTGMARSNLAAVSDGNGGFIFGRIKGNLSRQPDSLIYQIRSCGKNPEIPVLHWCGTSDRNISEAAIGSSKKTKAAMMKEILREMLKDGPRPEAECRDAVLAADISESTYKKHRKSCGVEVAGKDGFQGQSMLKLSEVSE